jgi:hypothetical protein
VNLQYVLVLNRALHHKDLLMVGSLTPQILNLVVDGYDPRTSLSVVPSGSKLCKVQSPSEPRSRRLIMLLLPGNEFQSQRSNSTDRAVAAHSVTSVVVYLL